MPEEKDGEMPLDRDDDVLHPEDFQKLEESENKKNVFKRLFSKAEKNDDDTPQEVKPDEYSLDELNHRFHDISKKLDDLLITVETQGGKIDMEKEVRSSLSERLMDLSSQVGELRSISISKERLFDKIEREFAQFKDAMTRLDPQKIEKQFQDVEVELSKKDVELEKSAQKITNLSNNLNEFTEDLKKFGEFKDVFDTLKKIKTHVDSVLQAKSDIERTMVKTEGLYVEMNDKAKNLNELEAKSSEHEGQLKEITDGLEKMNSAVNNLATKEEVKTIREAFEVAKKEIFSHDMKLFDADKVREELQELHGAKEKVDVLVKVADLYDHKLRELDNRLDLVKKRESEDNMSLILAQLQEQKNIIDAQAVELQELKEMMRQHKSISPIEEDLERARKLLQNGQAAQARDVYLSIRNSLVNEPDAHSPKIIDQVKKLYEEISRSI